MLYDFDMPLFNKEISREEFDRKVRENPMNDHLKVSVLPDVYKRQDVNGDGKLDDGDELIGTLNETSTGIYEMKELLYGKYLVRETKAPEGFELDKGVYSVFIEKDETTYEVENKAGVGFINTAMKGNLKIVKTSSDGKVEGFTFRVTGVNGYDRSFTTDKNGEIVIEGLRIGDYTVSEVQDSVSACLLYTSYLPAKGMTQLVQTISRVKKRINPNLKIGGMLLTLVDSRTNLAKSTVEALRENFGSQIKMYRTYIPIAVKAAETSSKGKSIYAYEPNSTVSKAYTEFTKEVLADGRKKERLHSHEAR